MGSKIRLLEYQKERISSTNCKFYFREATFTDYVTSCGTNGESATECIKKYQEKDTINLLYDETMDNNLRYVGKDPNNYVRFNNELWRMIGVMNNVDDGTGKKESRLKIIRDESVGEYSWEELIETI